MRPAIIAAACLWAASTLAITTGGDLEQISHAGKVDGWTLLDHSHVVVDFGPRHSYLLTLEQPCHHLSFAQRVGITNSNNTIYAGFDSVTADGWQCRIGRIQKVD